MNQIVRQDELVAGCRPLNRSLSLVPVVQPLEGEILGPRDRVNVLCALNPLRIAADAMTAPAGATVAEIVDLALVRHGRPLARAQISVHIDGETVSRDFWRFVRVKPGAPVVLRAVPGRFGDGNFLRSLLGLAVSILAFAVAGPIGGFWGAALGAGITIGGTLLIDALFPIRPTQLASSQASQHYSLSAGSNRAQRFDVIPVVHGTYRVYPKLLASYTEFHGDDQYLRCLFLWGYGPLDIGTLKLGETPLSKFTDVDVETRQGFPGDAAITLYPSQILQQDLLVELTAAAGWQTRVTDDAITEITVNLTAPNGIYVAVASKAELQPYTVNLAVQYRRVGTTAWLSIASVVLTARSEDQIQKAVRKSGLAAGQYEVRIGKTSGDYTGADRVSETVYWTILRGFRPGAPLHPPAPLAITALRIKATGQLNGAIDNLNAICTSIVPIVGGSAGASATNNCANLIYAVLQGPANNLPVPDENIDIASFVRFRAFCTTNSFTYNGIRDTAASVWDTCQDIAAAGRGRVTKVDGIWSVVFDDPTAPIVDHYTPANSWGFESKRSYRRLPHGFRVRFVNAAKGHAQDERIVYRDGYSAANATLFEGVEFPGITDPDLVWRFGRYYIAQMILRPEEYSLTIDLAWLAATDAARVRVTHDVPLFGLQAGRVLTAAGPTVAINEPVLMEAGKSYAVRFRNSDGTSIYWPILNAAGEQTLLERDDSAVVGSPPPTPDVGALFMFGEAGRETVVLRIKKIAPGANRTARLTLVDDAPNILSADTDAIPPYDSHVTDPVDPATYAPIITGIEEIPATKASVAVRSVRARLSWRVVPGNAAVFFQTAYRDDLHGGIWKSGSNIDAPGNSVVFFANLASGTYSFRVRAVFADKTYSDWSALEGQQLGGLAVQPENVAGLAIAVVDDSAHLTMDPPADPQVEYRVVRYTPATGDDVNWNTAQVVVPRLEGSQIVVPTQVGTYLVKNVSFGGVESPDPATLLQLVPGLRDLIAVEVVAPAPAWTGTKDSVVVAAGALELANTLQFSSWGKFSTWLGFTVAPQGLFTFAGTTDLGEVFTSRVSVKMTVSGENISNVISSWGALSDISSLAGVDANAWRVRLEERHTLDDPASMGAEWTDWTEVQVADLAARAFQFRLWLFSDNPSVTPVVSDVQITIDMPDRIIPGVNVLVPSTGLRVNFDPPFHTRTGFSRSDGSDLVTGDTCAVTSLDETGFNIAYFNSVGAAVARHFSFTAVGYGKRLTV